MLYKVWRKNPYFEMGAVYRAFDDGCEKAIMRTRPDGRQEILRYTGIVVPFETIRPYVIRIQQMGVDKEALLNRQKQAG